MSFPEKVLNNVDAQNYSLAVSLCTLNLPLTLGHLSAAGAKQAGEFGQNGEKNPSNTNCEVVLLYPSPLPTTSELSTVFNVHVCPEMDLGGTCWLPPEHEVL